MQPVAMVFERIGGSWKLAAAVDRPEAGWPALCTQGTPPTAPAVLPSASYATVLAQVLTRAMTGVTETSAAASPFAVNDFLAGSGSITAQSATQLRQDRQAGITFTGRFTPAPDPTLALPLANGRGFWMIGFLTPERYLQRALGAAREVLAGRQPGRHAQARRGASRGRHLHHHLHGDRPAAVGSR
jgi:hypothetical protein